MKRNIQLKISIILSILFLVACAAKKVSISNADLDRANEKYPETTMANLMEGKTAYESNCGSCHPLKAPSAESEDNWKAIVPKMVVKVNKKAGKVAIDTKGEESILRYLVIMCTAPKSSN